MSPGSGIARHVHVAAEEGNGGGQRMQELRAIRFAPRAARERPPIRRQVGNRAVHRREDPVVPRLELRVQQVRRPFGDQLPHRSFTAKRAGVVERRIDRRRRRGQGGHHVADERGSELADQPVGDRVGRGAAGPGALDQPLELRARSRGRRGPGPSSTRVRQRSRKSALSSSWIASMSIGIALSRVISRSRISRARMPSA